MILSIDQLNFILSDLFATFFKVGNQVSENDWLAEAGNSVYFQVTAIDFW
jgi:hypothetical protein